MYEYEITDKHCNVFQQQFFKFNIFKKHFLKNWYLIEQTFNKYPGRGQKVYYYIRKKAYDWPMLKVITFSILKFDISLEIKSFFLHPWKWYRHGYKDFLSKIQYKYIF